MGPNLLELPIDILGLFVKNQYPCYLLSLLVTNKELKEILESKDILDLISIEQGFPFVETLKDLCLFEKMNEEIFIKNAAVTGDKRVLEYKIEHGYKNYNWIAYGAAQGGHKDIVQWMIDLPEKRDYDWIAQEAAAGGHKDIVNFIKEWKATH